VYGSALYTLYISGMFQPLLWPSSGRWVTKDRYIEISQKFFSQLHRYKILNYKNNTWFKRHTKDENTDKNICD